MTEIAKVPPTLVREDPEDGNKMVLVPFTEGTVVFLTDGTDELAAAYDRMMDGKRLIDEAQVTISDELTRRLDEAVATGQNDGWTARAGNLKISVATPAAGNLEWDVEKLTSILADLVRDGSIAQALAAEAVKYQAKVSESGVGRLLKLRPDLKELVESAKRPRERPKPRRVKVERAA